MSAEPEATFAALLRHFRRAASLTQGELAERAGVSVCGVTVKSECADPRGQRIPAISAPTCLNFVVPRGRFCTSIEAGVGDAGSVWGGQSTP
jgi:hypothetical protein